MLSKSAKRKLFFFSVKSPGLTLSVVILTVISVLLVANYSYTNIVYAGIKGQAVYSYEKKGIIVNFSIERSVAKKLRVGQDVSWFLKNNGKWHKAAIIEIANDSEGIFTQVTAEKVNENMDANIQKDMEEGLSVSIDIITGREKVLTWLLSGNRGVQTSG